MIKKFSYILFLALALVVAACDDKNVDEPTMPQGFTVVLDRLTVAWDETEAVVDFGADQKWKVEAMPEWVSIDPRSGKPGEHRLFLNVQANHYRMVRSGEVMLVCGEKSAKILVTQGGCSDESAVAVAEFKGEMVAVPGTALKLSFSDFAKAIEGNLGMSVADFGKAIDRDGELEFFVLVGDKWVNGGSFAGAAGAWLDSDMNVVDESSIGWPVNAIRLECVAGDEPYIHISRAKNVPEGSEFELRFGFALRNDHTRFMTFHGTVKVVAESLSGEIVATYDMNAELAPASAYETTSLPFAAATIAEKLGVTSLDSCKVVSYDASGEFIKYTANNGYWFSTEGEVVKHGADAAWAIEYKGDDSWTLCPYPGVSGVGGTAKIGFWHGGKTVMFNIRVNIGAEVIVPAASVVETRQMKVTLPAGNNYETLLAPFDVASVAEKLGAAAITDCKVVSYDASGTTLKQTANNGYWYTSEGTVCPWGSTAAWAIEYRGKASETEADAYGGWTLCPYTNVSGVSGTSKIGFEYKGKAVIFEITVTIPGAAASRTKKSFRK